MLSSDAIKALDGLPEYDAQESLKLNQQLRQVFEPDVVAEILTQSRLRTAAVKKFGTDAGKFLYTQAALEQASRAILARYHAQRYVNAGIKHVVDFGCGIGADSIAFAQAGLRVTAIEQDSATAEYARYNLEQFPHTEVLCMDANDYAPDKGSGLWFDPARRSGNKRIFNPEDFTPPLTLAYSFADKGYAVGIKLGPAMQHKDIPAGCEAEWLSHDGDVTELCLWFNALTEPSVRRSAKLWVDEEVETLSSKTDFGEQSDIPVTEPKRYLYEPDGALIRGDFLGEYASEQELTQIDPDIAYLTSDENVESSWLTRYSIVDIVPYKIKTLKKYVKDNEIGKLTIKKRGIKETPEEIRKSLKPSGPNSATFIVARANGRRIVLIER